MRDIRFAWTDAAGNLMVTQCGDAVMYPGIDDEQAIDLACTRMKETGAMPPRAEPVPVAKGDIPADRKYRAAWKLDEGRIALDAAKVAAIEAADVKASAR